MAVDAGHLNFLLPQLISNRDLYYTNNGNAMGAYNDVGQEMMGGGGGVPLTTDLLPALQQSFVCDPMQPKTTSLNADSGLTCNVPGSAAAAAAAAPPPRKRSRDCFDNISSVDFFNNTNEFSQYPVGFDVASQFQRYQMQIDGIISQHTKKMRMEIEESQKRQARLVVQTIGKNLVHKLKEKDEQIQKMGKLNMLLQERLRSLYVENQLWRDMAHSNEAAANTLRVNLEQVLTHVSHDGAGNEGVNGGVIGVVKEEDEEDAQSSCGSTGSSNDHHVEEEEEVAVKGRHELEMESRYNNNNNNSNSKNSNNGRSKNRAMMMMCKVCGEKESCVLLLPCRHLCLCTLCGSSLLQACPVCNSNMNATVHVNMSSSS